MTAAEPLTKRLRAARLHDWREAAKNGVLTAAEASQLEAAHAAVAKVIEVDDFAADELSPLARQKTQETKMQDYRPTLVAG